MESKATELNTSIRRTIEQLANETRDGKEIDKQQRELEAEATAYVVGSYFGIQSPSDFYLASYRVTPAMLLEAVETIAATVKTILGGCQEPGQACAA
jgi:hypothetical protein